MTAAALVAAASGGVWAAAHHAQSATPHRRRHAGAAGRGPPRPSRRLPRRRRSPRREVTTRRGARSDACRSVVRADALTPAKATRRRRRAGRDARTFTLGPTPQNVDVYLDGKRQFAYDPDHTTIAVPWNGDHVLELRSPSGCCFVERVEIGPNHPLPPDAIIARRLKWRPAHLLVTTEPALTTARVLVTDPSRKVGGDRRPPRRGD